MSETNIRIGKIGDINASHNKGVINLLAISEDIKNTIRDSTLSPSFEQSNAKELLEKLRRKIEDTVELSDERKEKALKQVKELVEILKVNPQPGSDLQERADNAITIIKGLVIGASSVSDILNSLSAIAALLGIA